MKKIRSHCISDFYYFPVQYFPCSRDKLDKVQDRHIYNSYYSGKYLDRIAFPVGGIGAGMFCLEGTGAISHMSVRNSPDVLMSHVCLQPFHLKVKNGTKVLEGQVPDWKKFGATKFSKWITWTSYGLPRFENTRFIARFPFASIELHDNDIPLEVLITGWSPFIPTDEDNSSLPAGALNTPSGIQVLQKLRLYFRTIRGIS